MEKRIELLAPAGSIESFYAAVNSGADAVYLGGKSFNARQNSQNFDNDEIKHIIQYAHNKNVKVYVTMNIVLKDSEIVDALNYTVFLYNNDVDAVIVQDLGLFYLINRYLPDLNVNISTQGTVYDEYGVKFFEDFNVNKVILAREMSLSQIRDIVKKTNTNLEAFIHGALCACYSGQCYMSSFLGGRSGNRGKCAQPCRLNYSFYDKEEDSINLDFDVMPVLSMKDFKAGETICDLIDAGIKTFKIEGRMKGPEYTSKVVEYYRQIIDNYTEGKSSNIVELENKAISTFSRGYTNGYLMPSPEDDMFARTSSGVKGEDILDIADEVRDIANEFSHYRRNLIDFKIILEIGKRALLIASDRKNTVTINSIEPCELSERNPATEEIIEEQLGKLGNTIYELGSLQIEKEDKVFIRKSTLNQMRRDATEQLYNACSVTFNRTSVGEISSKQVFNFTKNNMDIKPKISLKINSNDEFRIVDNVKINRIYVPYNLDLNQVKKIEGVEKYLWTPNIVNKVQYGIFNKNMNAYEEIFDGVCVNNPGSFYFFKQKSNLKLHCGTSFNIINSFSAMLLKDLGAEGFTYSLEANIRDMESIAENVQMRSEITAHSYVKMMTMKNCPMSIIKNCKNLEDCDKCIYKNRYALKDRKGVYFNIERENRLTHIYNSVPLTLIGKTDDFINCGIEYFNIDTKWLDDSEEIVDSLYCEINRVQTANVLKENSFTRGHYLKNIL